MTSSSVDDDDFENTTSTVASVVSVGDLTRDALRLKRGRKKEQFWKASVVLLRCSTVDLLPNKEELKYLTENGFGIHKVLLDRYAAVDSLYDKLAIIYNRVPLRLHGFHLARCTKDKHIIVLDPVPTTIMSLEAVVKHSKLIVVPFRDIPFPQYNTVIAGMPEPPLVRQSPSRNRNQQIATVIASEPTADAGVSVAVVHSSSHMQTKDMENECANGEESFALDCRCVCDICGQAFDSSLDLDDHMSWTHKRTDDVTSDGGFIKVYNSALPLLQRVRDQTEQVAKMLDAPKLVLTHWCPDCRKSYLVFSHLIAHMRQHCTDGRYECKECGRVISSRGIYSHLRCHMKLKPFRCGLCHTCFVELGEFVDHVALHRAAQQETCVRRQRRTRHRCLECGATFESASDLSDHRCGNANDRPCDASEHDRLVPCMCEECGLPFLSEDALSEHMCEYASKAVAIPEEQSQMAACTVGNIKPPQSQMVTLDSQISPHEAVVVVNGSADKLSDTLQLNTVVPVRKNCPEKADKDHLKSTNGLVDNTQIIQQKTVILRQGNCVCRKCGKEISRSANLTVHVCRGGVQSETSTSFTIVLPRISEHQASRPPIVIEPQSAARRTSWKQNDNMIRLESSCFPPSLSLDPRKGEAVQPILPIAIIPGFQNAD